MNAIKRLIPLSTAFAVSCLFTVMCIVTDLHAATVVASLRGVTGPVDILRNGSLPAVHAKNGDKVAGGDLVRTKTGGFAEVAYSDGTILRIAQRSRVDIGEHFSGKSPDSGGVRLTRGKVQALVDLKNVKSGGTGPKKFEVRTPNAIAGVRGTSFFVSHERSVTSIFVQSGTVYSYNPHIPGQIVTLTPGTVTTVSGQNGPALPRPALQNEIQRMEQGMSLSSGGSGSGGGQGVAGTGSSGTGTGSLSSGLSGVYTSGDPLAGLTTFSPGPQGTPVINQIVTPFSPLNPVNTLTPFTPPPIQQPPVNNTVNVRINVNF